MQVIELNNNVIAIFYAVFSRNTPSPDEHCLAAQSTFHPACAQNPSMPNGNLPACHNVAEHCRKDYYCRLHNSKNLYECYFVQRMLSFSDQNSLLTKKHVL